MWTSKILNNSEGDWELHEGDFLVLYHMECDCIDNHIIKTSKQFSTYALFSQFDFNLLEETAANLFYTPTCPTPTL